MIKQKIATTIILKASPGCYITRKDDPDFQSSEVWLGCGDSVDNYEEVILEESETPINE